jgi:UDP-N-acetylglucosamine--N-acetylmuramyl-(pentapeptide) pyrophosphoryl-undecaprenol N-acetylglucosamine transferase
MLKLIKNPLKVMHQTGEKTFAETQALYTKAGFFEGFKLLPFLDNIAAAYAWADVVICRAGALTVSEIAAAGRAAIFIPLPIAVDDHQTKNAKYLVDQGAAKLIPQAKLTPILLAEMVDDLNVHREKIVEMGTRSKSLAKPGAAVSVAKELLLV